MASKSSEEENKDVVSQYSMFLPRGKNSLMRDYQEIKNIEELKTLDDNDLLFCWYYGHEASPFYEISNPREKAMLCYEYSYERVRVKFGQAPDKAKVITGSISGKVKAGISRMEKFRLSPRVRAVKFMEKTLDHFDKLINVDLDGAEFKKDGETDYTKKNQFINSLAKANDVIPILLARLENGYSVQDKKEVAEESDDVSFIDNLHENLY